MRLGFTLPTAAEPLRHRGFLILWTTSLSMNLAMWVQNIAATWWMISTDRPAEMIASIPLALAAPGAILSVASGVICDIFGWRRILLLAAVIISIGMTLLVGLHFQAWIGPIGLVLFTAALGCGYTVRQPAVQGFLGALVPPNLLLEAIALDSLNINLGRCLGPAFGGMIVAIGGVQLGFVTALVLTVSALLAVRYLPPPASTANTARPGLWPLLKEGLYYCFREKLLQRIYVIIFAFSASAQSVWVLIPISFAAERLENPALYGTMLSSIGAGAVVGAALRSTLGQLLVCNKAIAISLGIACVAPISLYFSLPPIAECILLLCFGVTWTTIFSTTNFIVQATAPPSMKGRAISYYLSSMYLGLASGSLLWGASAGALGVRETALLASVALFALCGWAIYQLAPAMRGAGLAGPDSLAVARNRS